MVGTTISHYKVLEKIGEGGMGVVYRATDTKLNRDVALKILPEQFASDSQRMGRFQREAEVLASLDHPNIGQIYGIEEAGQTRALVLQLIEGPTLADKIAQGPIPVEDALKIALQMAEGLEAAHEKGVIHRDLKPANIKITPEGQVKILDFGLAKAMEGEMPATDLSQSPTLTHAATQAGVILGTAAYMSPEQARGENADQRADVWAFGVVQFEMLTGRRTFEGRTVSDVLAAVLAKEPQWNSLADNLHPRLRQLLERCLSKELRDRYTGVGDARVDIQTVLADPGGVLVQPTGDVAQAHPQSKLPWVASLILAVITGVAGWNLRPTEPQPVAARFYHELPDGQEFSSPGRPLVAVSPDGGQIVYGANQQLHLRNLDEMEARPIQGTDEVLSNPFFSPYGEWVGYFSGSDFQLKKISTIGGASVTLCDATNPFGVSWGSDDTILFGQSPGIMRVSANGGTPELVVPTEAAEQVHGPQMLPGGEWVLFTLTSGTGAGRWDEAQIVVQSLESGERKILWEGGSDARYVPTGHLIYALEDVLFALPFDLASLEVSGGPVPIVEGVRRAAAPAGNTASANYGFSDRGTLIYVAGVATGVALRSLMAVDAEGDAAPLTDELRDYFRLRLSPDGRRVAAEVAAAGGTQIWIVDIETGIGSQLTFEGSENQYPTWAADGQTVVFQRDREALYKKAADGSGEEELVFQSENSDPRPTDVSPDGVLAFFEPRGEAGGRDIWTLQLEDGSASAFLATPANESMAMFSADGQWLAYVSNQSGQDEVYVRPYPQGSQRLISDGGGTAPIWSRNGEELYYRSLSGNLMAVPIQTSPSFVPGRLRELFPVAGFRTSINTAAYDIDVSGEGFIMVSVGQNPDGASSQRINIVLNWFEELKERVPVP